eukprot:COSAG01_NODE_3307_length_6288_cov_62.023913_2_plen_280_part_00
MQRHGSKCSMRVELAPLVLLLLGPALATSPESNKWGCWPGWTGELCDKCAPPFSGEKCDKILSPPGPPPCIAQCLASGRGCRKCVARMVEGLIQYGGARPACAVACVDRQQAVCQECVQQLSPNGNWDLPLGFEPKSLPKSAITLGWETRLRETGDSSQPHSLLTPMEVDRPEGVPVGQDVDDYLRRRREAARPRNSHAQSSSPPLPRPMPQQQAVMPPNMKKVPAWGASATETKQLPADDHKRYTSCVECVRAGFGWSLTQRRCGGFSNRDCTADSLT